MKYLLTTAYLLPFLYSSYSAFTPQLTKRSSETPVPPTALQDPYCKQVSNETCKKVTKTVYDTKIVTDCKPTPVNVCAEVDERTCEPVFMPIEEGIAAC